MMREEFAGREDFKIGLRINPQVGAGAFSGWSTATRESKFGMSLENYQEQLVDLFGPRQLPSNLHWSDTLVKSIVALHVHVGSQGCELSLIAEGIAKVFELAESINQIVAQKDPSRQQITTIDIGGGLPVNFDSESDAPSFSDWSSVVRERMPALLDSQKYRVITEFGRAVIAKTGYVAARVEYVKQSGGTMFAMVQTGADLFVRTVYHPEKWKLRTTVLDQRGGLKAIESSVPTDHKWSVAGPCCFGLDIIAYDRFYKDHKSAELSEVSLESGDWILLHDTGGYYHSSYSFYNLRQAPPIIGFSGPSDSLSLSLLVKAKSVDDTLSFFE